MSYAIPTNELTLTDIKQFKLNAINAGIERARVKGIGVGPELVVREALPLTDFGQPAALAGYVGEYYVTLPAVGALAWALVYDTAAPAGPAVAPALPVGRIAVFYKIVNAAAAPVTTGVRFRVGATGATTKAAFFIQSFQDIKLEPEVWLSEPVVYDPQDILFIEFYGRAATPAGGEELGFGCFIIERVGATVS